MSQLIVIDQGPIIEEALDACDRARRSIESLKEELRRFEQADLPAFDRWYHSTFGRRLTEIRDLSNLLLEKKKLLAEAKARHWKRFFDSQHGAIHAEQEVGRGGDAREELSEEAGFRTFDAAEEEGAYGPEHEDLRYEESDELHDDEEAWYYSEDAESRRRFEELFTREGAWRNAGSRRRGPEGEARSDGRARAEAGSERERAEGAAAEEAPLGSGESTMRDRIKDRYRMLVRRLHPDLNTELTAEEKSLWNQVQAAYEAENLEQLDLLVALTDAFSGRLSREAGVHHLRRAAQEIERLAAPLKRRIEQARRERAWGFTLLEDTGVMRQEVERGLVRELTRIRNELVKLDAQIARFLKEPRGS